MGLPSQDRPPGATNAGSYYDNTSTAAQSTMNSEDARDLAMRSSAAGGEGRERDGVGGGEGVVQEVRTRGAGGRRPSGQQRMCGKCQRHLTGQFVRALGDTYHLECFTCHV
jgi:hypothetical protein